MTQHRFLLVFLLLHTMGIHAQYAKEFMTADDVEKRVSIWSTIYTAPVYPQPDSINRKHVKKAVQLMGTRYADGSFNKARAREKFDRQGYILYNHQREKPFWSKRKWLSDYSYSENHRQINVVSTGPQPGTYIETMTVDKNGRLKDHYQLPAQLKTEYCYDDKSEALIKIVTSDSSGRHKITTIDYDSTGRMTQLKELSIDSSATDTITILNIMRDTKGRIIRFEYFTKNTFSFVEGDPTSLKFTTMSEDYKYDEHNRVIVKVETNEFHTVAWTTSYYFDNDKLRREEQTMDSVTTIFEHFRNGLIDSVTKTHHCKNYRGLGPRVVPHSYQIVVCNEQGLRIESTEYLIGFGIEGYSSRMIANYDDNGRLMHREYYEYDFRSRQIVQRTGSDFTYYDNGLPKSEIHYGPNHEISSACHWKYKFYK